MARITAGLRYLTRGVSALRGLTGFWRAVAILPMLIALAHALWGGVAVNIMALAAPAVAFGAVACRNRLGQRPAPVATDPRVRLRHILGTALDHPDGHAACLIVHAEDLDQVTAQAGPRGADLAMAQLRDRLTSVVREADAVERLEDSSFAIVFAPDWPMDLETLMQIAARVQAAATEQVILDAGRVRLRASVGLCQSDALAEPTSETVLDAAETALLEARACGSGSIRVYAPAMQARRQDRQGLMEDAQAALENGEIQSWFQPQVCTDTGKVSGFEALARWNHPVRGKLSPATFLPAIEAAGLLERLGEVMVDQSLDALAAWDKAGFCVPCVGVNLSPQDLNNPVLAERIAWQIDRFDLTPDRLAIEVLESVVAQAPDDAVGRNIAALATLGCHVDLDDFGTGHASITTLRSLRIGRIKIDRSFVAKVDTDREQQRMIATILAMCDHLGLKTLAEGVESQAEHAMLAQLGCGHVQGYAIGHPMSFDSTMAWLEAHANTLSEPPSWTRKLG